MSFADPQSVTINAVAISLPRVAAGNGSGQFTSADQNTSLLIANQYGSRTRRTVRLNIKKIAANPYNPAVNSTFSMSAYLVVDIPLVGFTTTEQFNNVAGLTGYLTASSGARVTQLLGGEN
jgi:hypothetical protein